MFKEYPKCLIQGDEHVVVFDAAQEELARSKGFRFHDEVEAEAHAIERKKPGRKPKVIE